MNKRPRGRPRKVFPSAENLQGEQLALPGIELKLITGENTEMAIQKLKQIARPVNRQGIWGEDGSMPLTAVEEYVQNFLNEGFKLVYVNIIGQNDVMVNMLYVLIKEE